MGRGLLFGVVLVAFVGLTLLLSSSGALSPLAPKVAAASGVKADASTCSIEVTVSSAFAFGISNNYCAPGSTISLEVLQTDSTAHTFTLIPAANFSFNPGSNTTDQIQTFLDAHPPLVNIVVSTNPGSANFTNFSAPPVGAYQYVCMEQGHFTEGMYGEIGIGVHVASTSAPDDGPGAPVFIIAGTITGLVVIALVLGFVVGRRREDEDMPPERLGYPEPSETENAPLPTNPAPVEGNRP
jgi:plastocyanin